MLHALGQPLTVLGGWRLIAQLPSAASAELTEEMTEQAERATEIYRGLRLLLEGGRGEVEVGALAEEWGAGVGVKGVRLGLHGLCGRVQERVLVGVFAAGLQSCCRGGELRLDGSRGWIEVWGGNELKAGPPWELRVAEAVQRDSLGDGGAAAGMVDTLQPFHVRVRVHLP